MSENVEGAAQSPRSKRSLKETIGTANAVASRVDQGYDSPLNWDQTVEAVQHPLRGLNKLDLIEVVAYLGAQLVGARNSIDADAALAMTQIEAIVRRFQERRASPNKDAA